MNVGRITFGSQVSESDWARRLETDKLYRSFQFKHDAVGTRANACNCIGPQAGESKCPCALRAESEQGRRMVREGVVINGVAYDLVPRASPHTPEPQTAEDRIATQRKAKAMSDKCEPTV